MAARVRASPARVFYNVEMSLSRARSGAQSTERALLLLRTVATRGQIGWRLSDLSSFCGLGISTTHRLLQSLVRERLVRQREVDRHYVPGPMLFELGLALPRSHTDFVDATQTCLARVARKTGVMAYLMLRSGPDLVCAARAGALPQQAYSIEPGSRRPLLSGAHGIAILIELPEAERRRVVERNLRELQRLGSRWVRALEGVLAASVRAGFGVHRGEIVAGVHALAVPVIDQRARPFASLSLLGPADALPASRSRSLVALLRTEAAFLAREAVRLGLET
ncbi:MAG TPA: IclR family transcriptional regulator [Burkholderiales bacterium]|nr:IclR family transcriptional regulator [Burkholderiales bacterium]